MNKAVAAIFSYLASGEAKRDRPAFDQLHWSTLGLLFSGRLVYRASHLVVTLMLVRAWSPAGFGEYCSQVGGFSILAAVLGTGVEKTLLNVIPISANHTRRLWIRYFLNYVKLTAAIVGIFCFVTFCFATPAIKLTVLAGTLVVSQACHQILAAIGRISQRPYLDYVTYSVAGVSVIVLGIITWIRSWPPLYFCALQIACVTAIGCAMYALIGEHDDQAVSAPDLAAQKRTLRLYVSLTINELLGMLPISAVFWMLYATHQNVEAANFGVLQALIMPILASLHYFLRLFQPAIAHLTTLQNISSSRPPVAYVVFLMIAYLLVSFCIVLAATFAPTDKFNIIIALVAVAIAVPVMGAAEIALCFQENVSVRGATWGTTSLLCSGVVAICIAIGLFHLGWAGALAAILIGDATLIVMTAAWWIFSGLSFGKS